MNSNLFLSMFSSFFSILLMGICGMGDTIEITCIQRTHTECEIEPSVCLNLNDENTEEDRVTIRSYENFKDTVSFDILSPTNLTHVPAFIFHKFPKLRQLRIINAGIKSLKAESFVSGHRLVHMDLRRNQIAIAPRQVFANLMQLEEVNLAYNKIARIEAGAFDSVPLLKTLVLSNNLLQSIESRSFIGAKELAELHLDSNLIQSIDADAFDFPRLEILSLRDNRLKSLPINIFANLTSLEKIDLSHNELTEIGNSLRNCDQLYSLSLSHNPNLKDADVFEITKKMPSISYLYLANTGFRMSERTEENPNFALTHLDLSSNELNLPNLFAHLTQFKKLKTVILNNNNFTHLNYVPVLKSLFPRLDTIQLKNNSNLKLDWLQDAKSTLQKQHIKLVTGHRFTVAE